MTDADHARETALHGINTAINLAEGVRDILQIRQQDDAELDAAACLMLAVALESAQRMLAESTELFKPKIKQAIEA
jgi:hypothetical protein